MKLRPKDIDTGVNNCRNNCPISNQDGRLANHRATPSPFKSTSSIRTTHFNRCSDRSYVERESPQRRYSTQQSHSSILKRWILPRWGDRPLEEIKPVAVEEWLRSLTLAPKTKVNLRSLFHLISEHARRWELIDRKPRDKTDTISARTAIPDSRATTSPCLANSSRDGILR